MNVEMPKFLGCPFCGNQPKIEIQEPVEYDTRGVWVWLRCNCFEVPQHKGVNRSTHRRENYPHGEETRYRTNEAAAQDALNDMARYWNTRAPINNEAAK
jgi:hypothetical protein